MTKKFPDDLEFTDDEQEALDVLKSARRFSGLSPDAIDRVITSWNNALAKQYPELDMRASVDRFGVLHIQSKVKGS